MALSKILLSDGVTELANVKSVTYKEAVNAGVDIRPGCVGSASIEVEVYDTQANAVPAGEEVKYYQYDITDAVTLIGVFTVEPSIETKNSYKFTAYDNAQKLDVDFSAWLLANQSSFPMTVYDIVSAACTIAGVTLNPSSWPLSTQSVQAFYADGLTCRQIVSYAAELAGCFARCHADGELYFDWYSSSLYDIGTAVGVHTVAYKQSGLNYSNFTVDALDGVAVHPNGTDDAAYIYPVSASGNLLHVKNNLLLMGADASFYNAAAQRIYNAVSAIGQYTPMSVNLFPRENPFRAGDIVGVTDAQGVSFFAPITAQTVKASAATLESSGRERLGDDGNLSATLAQLASDIVRIDKLKVNWADIDTAIIDYLTANDVTAKNLTIVDENGNVLATFNASGITLGETDKGHAFIDFNSFELFDRLGNKYLSVGDLGDGTGYSLLVETITPLAATNSFTVSFDIRNIVSVTINGVETTVTSYFGKTLSTADAAAAQSTVVITYHTEEMIYHYDLGTRSGNVGAYSVALGRQAEASGEGSSVGGGLSNGASGANSVVSGGSLNYARGENSTVCGGGNNTAYGTASAIGGGYSNIARGYASTIVGGINNYADSLASTAMGQGCHAYGIAQTVLGKYNSFDSTMAEIVGNGSSDTARSNARTLDWNGNEYLAGALSVGNPTATLANLGGVPLVVLTNMTANTSAALLSALNGENSSIPIGVSLIQLGNSSVGNRALMICTKINATLGRGYIVSAYAINGTTVTLGSGGWT